MVFGLSKKKQIDEREAEGEVEQIFHEVMQTLRVTGVSFVFRALARREKSLNALWETIRPNAQTRVFEDAADAVRAQAVSEADQLGRLNVSASVSLGESQAYQIKAALDLYHYLNPKLLVILSAARLSLTGQHVRELIEGTGFLELTERGAPEKMYPMELVPEEPKEERLADLFEDIKQALGLPSIPCEYRTLALWPDYLIEAWTRLRTTGVRNEYNQAAERVRQAAREGARRLPYPMLSREQLEELGEDTDDIIETTETFEDALAPLTVNMALLQLDWHDLRRLLTSPFPAAR
jgi:hypothetical protein